MDLQLDQLRALNAVLTEGTFDAAARRLDLTPSAVSQRIKSLEEAAGRVLVKRSKPVRPTESGLAVLRLAGVADAKAVGKWAKGTRKPQPDSERKLRDAYQIAVLIAATDDEATARAWFSGMNPALDHRAPAWVIANFDDGGDRAMAAALAFVSQG